jgi:hypothetical protein
LRTTQGKLSLEKQYKNICDKCFQHYIIETKQIREHINNMLGFKVTKYNYDSCDEECKSLPNFPNEHYENCAFIQYPDGIKKEKYDFDEHCYSYEIFNYNKKIIELFNSQLGDIRVIILGWNCNIYAYIFDEVDYEINLNKLISILLKFINEIRVFDDYLNWKFRIRYKYESSEAIIYDLIQFSKTGISKIGNDVDKNGVYKKKREMKKVYLNVSYNDKDKIKNIGGKWDLELRLWYVSKQIYSKNEDFITSFSSVYT